MQSVVADSLSHLADSLPTPLFRGHLILNLGHERCMDQKKKFFLVVKGPLGHGLHAY